MKFGGTDASWIDRNWHTHRLSLLAIASNDGHESEEVAALPDEKLNQGSDWTCEKCFTISDFALAKVLNCFDTTLRTTCAIRSLNRCIGYGIGLKKYPIDPKTNQAVKNRVIVTDGGPFPEGGAVIRKLRALKNSSDFSANKPWKSPEPMSQELVTES
ncbi:Hypothetical protein PHPALM_19819 [Phytophthora palmivora]|uniref:Uncharacterized protein n=1 Tax=Phytophthora palmivora TaxID=4796 RepID=A0A2P4XGF6_9STRA|nr:Hypothetical protein PHPALM_19819 [Phytophthora palmivora]